MPKDKKLKRDDILSPKGMRDIMNDDYYLFQGFFEKAQEIAMYYGFSPIMLPTLEHEHIFTVGIGKGTDLIDKEMYSLKTRGGNHLALRPEGTAGAMRSYIEHGMHNLPQPVMVYYYGPFFRHDKPQKGRYREFWQFGLEIMGSVKSINDALIIKVNSLILEEAGFTNSCVQINSTGDKESRVPYVKDLKSYYQKHAKDLCKTDRERIKTNPLRILDSKDPVALELKADAPSSLNYLSTTAKKHFKEVLEYLDEMEVSYRIEKSLVRGLSYYTNTVFEIDEKYMDDESGEEITQTLIGGGRYDGLGKLLGSKKEIPGVGSGIGVDRVVSSPNYKKLTPRIIKKPKFYFIQLGSDAKLKSLTVIDILRKGRVPIIQSLAKDSLSSQLGIAEKLEVPYAIIFGQKEAIDSSVIVRAMGDRTQKTVKFDKLIEHIKSLK